MEEKRWWYVLNNQQSGPLTHSEILLLAERKIIHSDTRLRKEGFQNWIKFSDTPFKSGLRQTTTFRRAAYSDKKPEPDFTGNKHMDDRIKCYFRWLME